MTRVIVVDDQTVVREGLVLLLRLLPDIEVLGAAAGGEEALRLVATERPDVVLMDLGMPKMDDVEATVKSHINNLFAKTGVRDRAQAVTYAFRRGLVG
ncbi:response regulator [Kibdelosporangium philippinense]|uniref:Response regulator n=1 Tax=Kibdelosporangium philippinense TaxID=211113 RepID=A0ABS8Z4U9_9PSEU|nr:response regulator [Kibdelosporangium philippinense]MCE7002933.1 response regulator [Kibdelosporangium philippinense]